MSQNNNGNARKTKLIMITLAIIIVLLLIGIIYQFVHIKKLESQVGNIQSEVIIHINDREFNHFL